MQTPLPISFFFPSYRGPPDNSAWIGVAANRGHHGHAPVNLPLCRGQTSLAQVARLNRILLVLAIFTNKLFIFCYAKIV